MAAAVGVLATATTVASAATFFQYSGQPHEYTSRGGSGTLTDADVTFTPRAFPGVVEVDFVTPGPSPTHYGLVQIAMPAGHALGPGTYTLGQPAGLANLVVGIDGEACDNTTGEVTILELTLDSANQSVTTMAADFVVRCESEDPRLAGGIRINSSVPYNPPTLSYDGPAFFQWISQPGDYVGDGQSNTFTRSNGYFVPTAQAPGIGLYFWPESGPAWDMHFANANGGVPTPGTYTSVQGWPSVGGGHPAMDVGNPLRFCNTQAGSFTILDIAIDVYGMPTRLAVDFEQHCGGAAPALIGGIRYNSDIPYVPATPAPVPGSITALDGATIPVYRGTTISGPRFQVRDSNSAILQGATVEFTTTCGSAPVGPAVDISTDSSGIAQAPSFTAPDSSTNCVLTAALPGTSVAPANVAILVYVASQVTLTPLPSGAITVAANQVFQVGANVSLGALKLSNVQVGFSVLAGTASPATFGGLVTTDSSGNAYIQFRAGSGAGTYQILAGSQGAALSIAVTQTATAGAAPTFIQYSSQAGDAMGLGTSGNLTSSDGTFTPVASASNHATLQFHSPSSTTWSLDFATARGVPFGTGTLTYTSDPAYSDTVSGYNGMLATIDGRACGEPSGRFVVREVAFDSQHAVTKLAVDFEQHCSSSPGSFGPAAGLYGGVRFNSSVPYAATGVATHTQRLAMSSTPMIGGYGWSVGPLRTRALDNSQNPVSNATVQFTAGNCGTFNGQEFANVSTDASGIATSPPLVLGSMSTNCFVGARVADGSIDGFQDFPVIIFDPTRLRITPSPQSITVSPGQGYAISYAVSSDVGYMPGLDIHFAVQQATGGAEPVGSLSDLATDDSNRVTLNLSANGLDGAYTIVASVGPATASVAVNQETSGTPPSITPGVTFTTQDMWWNSSENGWGMSLVQHNDILFGAFYIYDANGKPTWCVMPGGHWDSTHAIYSGSLYQPTGTPFFAYNAQGLQVGNAIGTVSISFQDANNATVDYTIGGVTGRKFVTREIFANGTAVGPDRSDLWWGGASQNGWGITVLQQAATLFAVWYTYDASGHALWYVMPGGSWTASDTYEGTLYRTTGSPWVGKSYDPTKLQVINAGTYKFQFNGDAATFTYSADGHSGSLPLVKEPF